MKKQHTIVLAFLLFARLDGLNAQGCSDAGACSIESFTAQGEVTELKNEISLGVSYGAADHSIGVLGAQLGYTRRVGSSFSVDTRLTYFAQSGNDISESGLGDLFVIANYKPSMSLTLSAGVKLPTNSADKRVSDFELPMDYQSSLGTVDLIVGLAFQQSNWLFALGYQKPLQQNDNDFQPFYWEGPLSEFQNTFDFDRKADVLLRISRIVKLSDKLTVVPGLLPIYHVAEDTYSNYASRLYAIAGSDGLTINATAHFLLQVSEKNKLGFHIGFPLVVRDARPDGLTRSFVVGAEYGLKF